MYTQNIKHKITGWEKTLVRITNFDKVPKRCYCRFDASGCARLTVYTVSEDGKYMIAEGDSDHTVFILLKVKENTAGNVVATYVNDGTNPMDEMYSRLCAVHWYEEQGFCKLEFFNMDIMPDAHDIYRRIYFE